MPGLLIKGASSLMLMLRPAGDVVLLKLHSSEDDFNSAHISRAPTGIRLWAWCWFRGGDEPSCVKESLLLALRNADIYTKKLG